MMLSSGDLLLIVLTAALCTAGIGILAFGILWWGRRLPLAFQTIVVIAAAIASIVASTTAISAEMYLSAHDLQVLLWVVGISALFSLVAALTTARIAQRSFALLHDSLERIGDGEIVIATPTAGKELAELSAQLAQTSQRLADAREEIERLDASRRQLFAWISHDLRTPLTSISALSEALEESSLDDPSNYLRQIRAQTVAMNRLVDDLFELSQIHSGTLKLRMEDISLLDVVSDAVADVLPTATAREIRIIHAGIQGHTLHADPHELTRVVVNLLTNSIRHAPTGSEILIAADRQDNRMIISVIDQGSGVESEDLSRMFEVGWRAVTARTPQASSDGSAGAGLGLAIVQGIVEAHGGHVDAENLSPGFRLNIALPVT